MPQANYRFEARPYEAKPPFEGGLPLARRSSRNSLNPRPDRLEPNRAWRSPSGSRVLAEENLSPPQLPRPCYGRILVPAYAMVVEAALSGEILEIHESTVRRRWFARSRSSGALARRPRYHVHFTPTSASWINQVERWFAELTRKQLQRGVHTSTNQLEADIRTFIERHNENPKPYKWTKSADEILASVKRFCQKTQQTLCSEL